MDMRELRAFIKCVVAYKNVSKVCTSIKSSVAYFRDRAAAFDYQRAVRRSARMICGSVHSILTVTTNQEDIGLIPERIISYCDNVRTVYLFRYSYGRIAFSGLTACDNYTVGVFREEKLNTLVVIVINFSCVFS